MHIQGYRCAGCHMEVEPYLSKYYRYCYYHGKYFCQSCHSNSKTILPALVIHEWNFKQKPVSNIAFDFLKKIEEIPHYNIAELNKEQLQRVVPLQMMLQCRIQLLSLRQYIKTCRLAQHLNQQYEEFGHLATDLNIYSLKDFVRLDRGELQKEVRQLLEKSVLHVRNCDICKYKGHYCEICKNNDEIIYPFEIHRIYQCQRCHACFHKSCFKDSSCPKCIRISKRNKYRENELSGQDEQYSSELR